MKAAESIELLVISLNRLTENTSVKDLVKVFEFDNCFEIIEAIEYYQEREIYNACEALDIILTNNINNFIK